MFRKLISASSLSPSPVASLSVLSTEVALLLLVFMPDGVSVPPTEVAEDVVSEDLGCGTCGRSLFPMAVTGGGFALAESRNLSSFEIKSLVN